MEQEKAKTAQNIVSELQISTAWKDRSSKKSYRKGFSITKEIVKGNAKLIIHNKNKPQIVHLLEKGHVGRNGKRVEARPHMGPIAEKHLKSLEETIENAVKNGV